MLHGWNGPSVSAPSVDYRPLSIDLAEPPTTTTHSHKSFNVDIQHD